MTQKVTVAIRSEFLSTAQQNNNPPMELLIDGTMRQEDGALTVEYQWTTDQGEKIHNVITLLSASQVEILGKGDLKYTIRLQKGAATTSVLQQDDLEAQLQTRTTKIESSLTPSGGALTLAYQFLTQGSVLTQNEIQLYVTQKEAL